MKQFILLIALIITFTCNSNATIEESTQDALITKGSYTLTGTFGAYDFSDAKSAFDWAFTSTNGTSYQLQGKPPSDTDVFGWKKVSIATPTPAWYMISLGDDVDGDGSKKFDWVLLSTNLEKKAAYKLKGETESGTFDYSKKLDIDYVVEGSNVTIISDAKVPLLYNYNDDKSSLYTLPTVAVNQYEDIQRALNRVKNDKKAFDSTLAGFIGSLFLDAIPTDSFASYAPRGEMKSKIVSVKNSTVDYSDYVLKADIDFNAIVDSNDLELLSTALFKGYESSEYDVNGDGEVNTADIVYLIARFGSEIKSYDFYTTSGEKLSLASRSVDEARSFTYSGDETRIMVVAKDINGASGFERGLSDSDDVWYKQTGWILQNSDTLTLNRKMRRLYSSRGISSEEFLKKDNIYLLGWSYSVDYYGNLNLPSNMVHSLMNSSLSSYFNDVIEMNSYGFSKTNMKHPPQRTYTERKIRYNIGSLVDQDNQYIESHIMNSTYTKNGKVITVRDILFIVERLYYSLADKLLAGTITTRTPTTDAKGTVIIERIGPEPKGLEFEPETIDDLGMFGFTDVPFGDYSIDYLDECLCHKVLDEHYIFENENSELDYTIDLEKVKITLQLLDRDNQPISGESIALLAKACVNSDDEEKSFNATTDSSGNVIFDNVPIGDYTVFVGDKENSSINVCSEYVGTLYPDPLWDIDITFTGRFCDYEKSIKKVKIANTSDATKAWPTNNSYPFPLESDYGGKVLVNTSYYTGEEYGISLQYHPDGIYSSYSKGLSIVPEAIEEMLEEDKCAGDTWFGDPKMQEWIGINTVLDASQTAAFYKHEAFTLHDAGEWINNNPHKNQNPDGFSTLTVTFTPSN